MLAERDVEGLSLREMARMVGVSATAVYRHFPDKTALAREGLNRLTAAQHAAADGAGGGVRGFATTGQAYVRFALANPAVFRLIFTSSAVARSSGEAEALMWRPSCQTARTERPLRSRRFVPGRWSMGSPC
jgi:AcrR family transcriptional regulator